MYDWPHSRPYLIGSVANWGLFLAAVWLLAWGTDERRLATPALWLIVLVVTA